MIFKETNYYKYRPYRFLKPVRSAIFILYLVFSFFGHSQNTLTKTIAVSDFSSVLIQGNQIFNISVRTINEDVIKITSTLDGEYQNNFQIGTKIEGGKLVLNLVPISFEEIPDDKRNAHKVIAANLEIEVPENFDIDIKSDVGSAEITGMFNNLFVKLLQGSCTANATGNVVTIHTVEGDIMVITKYAKVVANSNRGKVTIDEFDSKESKWFLRSVKGDITVAKQE